MRVCILPLTALGLLACPLVGLAAPPGSATPSDPAPELHAALPTSSGRTLPIAVGVNFPAGWLGGKSVAASLYVGVTSTDAIRANFARYENTASLVGDVLSVASGGDGSEASHGGHITDLSVGLVHYSRALWDGLTLEAGALRRARDTQVFDDFASPASVDTTSTTYAGRALIGWSWLVHQHLFISFAVGGSVGIERGTERTANGLGQMQETVKVDRSAASPEAYLRFGGAFDL